MWFFEWNSIWDSAKVKPPQKLWFVEEEVKTKFSDQIIWGGGKIFERVYERELFTRAQNLMKENWNIYHEKKKKKLLKIEFFHIAVCSNQKHVIVNCKSLLRIIWLVLDTKTKTPRRSNWIIQYKKDAICFRTTKITTFIMQKVCEIFFVPQKNVSKYIRRSSRIKFILV